MCCLGASDPCIHDNEIYGYQCDISAGKLTLHTVFKHPDCPAEYTDVVFEGVEVHRLVDVYRPQNMLDEIMVGEIKDIRGLVTDQKSLADHGKYLSLADEMRCHIYHIRSTNGMRGWVAAQSVELVKREQPVTELCCC